jgi:hypothetical protein
MIAVVRNQVLYIHTGRLSIRCSGPGDRRDLPAKLYDVDGPGAREGEIPPAAACPGGQARELIAVRHPKVKHEEKG